ncbi:MAG TPA: GGDEF domain-containing protein [Pararhizobium sp.]|jgi:diguanylate cyclase (GGDEF)-like protein|nr:GGDEF domain-containing protein [Pararhizobium sp.]
MRLHKAELFFLLLMILVGLSGVFGFVAHQNAVRLMGAEGRIGLNVVRSFSFMGATFSGLAAVCGLFLVYPVIRRGLREQGELQRMTESLSVRSQTLEQAALTDPLTGMHNRRYFDDAMVEYLQAFREIGKPVGMMILDLDRFKSINDTHGHDVGDEVLRRVANCLMEFTRYHDVVARLGGEEFAVLSPNTSQRQLYALADRIRSAVGNLRIVSGNVTLRVTVSVGLAIWDGREGGDELYRRADKQLYEAKRQGRNRVSAA